VPDQIVAAPSAAGRRVQLLRRVRRTLLHLADIYEKRQAFSAGKMHRELADQVHEVIESLDG